MPSPQSVESLLQRAAARYIEDYPHLVAAEYAEGKAGGGFTNLAAAAYTKELLALTGDAYFNPGAVRPPTA